MSKTMPNPDSFEDTDEIGLCITEEISRPKAPGSSAEIAPPAIYYPDLDTSGTGAKEVDVSSNKDVPSYPDPVEDHAGIHENPNEEDVIQNQPSRWRAGFRKALMALGLLGMVGTASGLVKHAYERGDAAQETAGAASVSTPQENPGASSVDEPETNASVQIEPASIHPPVETLYDRIGIELEAHTQTAELSPLLTARFHAEITNALTESLYTGSTWQDLDGSWLDTATAQQNVVAKLRTWGGYEDVLTVSASAQSIDEMLEQVAASDLPDAELVAWKLATQIASIQDSEVVPNVETVKERMSTIETTEVKAEIQERLPPATETAQLDDVYDAPAPGNLQGMNSFDAEDDVSDYLTLEDAGLEDSDMEDTATSPFDAPEPRALLDVSPDLMHRSIRMVEVEEYDEPDIAEPAPAPAPAPAPSFVERAKTAINSLVSGFKSWWS